MRYSRKNLLNLYSHMVKDETSSVEIIGCLKLEFEEFMYLSGSTKASRKMQKIYDEAQELLREGNGGAEKTEFFKTPGPSKNNTQISSACTVKSQEKKEEKSSENRTFPNSKLLKARKKVSIAALIFSLRFLEKISLLKVINLIVLYMITL